MYLRLNRVHRTFPVVLGVVTLASVGVLLTWDIDPRLFAARAHDFLAAFPLAMIAFAYLLLPSGTQASARGSGEGDSAGDCVSLLGSQSAVAQSSPGDAFQRYCDCAFCIGCVFSHGRLAEHVTGPVLCEDL